MGNKRSLATVCFVAAAMLAIMGLVLWLKTPPEGSLAWTDSLVVTLAPSVMLLIIGLWLVYSYVTQGPPASTEASAQPATPPTSTSETAPETATKQ